MSSSELKTGINKMLTDVNDERFLRTMYAMVSEYTDGGILNLSPEQKRILEDRKKSHKAGQSKSFSVKQMKALVLKNIK